MSSGNDVNRNNGDDNLDGQPQFSSFHGEPDHNSQTSAGFALPGVESSDRSSHHQEPPVVNIEGAMRNNQGPVRPWLTVTARNNQGPVRPWLTDTTSDADSSSSVSPYGKLKPANVPALSLEIGTWKVSKSRGDLVATFSFKKEKLVWSFLDGFLKRKIECKFSDISAIENQPLDQKAAILRIRLDEPAEFYEQAYPQPQRISWEKSCDVIDNQASLLDHSLVVDRGALQQHYKDLLKAVSRLRDLSHKPFAEKIPDPSDKDSPVQNDMSYSSGHDALVDCNPNMELQNQKQDGEVFINLSGDGKMYIDLVEIQPLDYSTQEVLDHSVDQMPPSGNLDVPSLGFDQPGGSDYKLRLFKEELRGRGKSMIQFDSDKI